MRLLRVFERKEVSRASTERKYLESFSGGEQVYALQCEGRICCVLHALLVALFFQSQRFDINEQFGRPNCYNKICDPISTIRSSI